MNALALLAAMGLPLRWVSIGPLHVVQICGSLRSAHLTKAIESDGSFTSGVLAAIVIHHRAAFLPCVLSSFYTHPSP